MFARKDLLKAPSTALKKGACVRTPRDENALVEGTTRWEFGRIVKISRRGELIDVAMDNGELMESQPTFEFFGL